MLNINHKIQMPYSGIHILKLFNVKQGVETHYCPLRNRRRLAINGGVGEKLKKISGRVAINEGGGWKNCISSVVSCGDLFHSLLTELSE